MAASRVAAGILVSRLLGLVRERVFAFYFGNGPLADAWRAALKIPNVLQNLLGEGSLSASFIPVYVRLLEEGREEQAGKVAGAVLGLLTLAAGALAVSGALLAPWIAEVLLAGFEGVRQETTVTLLRILFPMTGILVVSAWLIGILNSHGKFFTSYVAPAVWNVAMIVVLVVFGGVWGRRDVDLIVLLGWGALAGGVLQLLVQIPFAAPHLRALKVSIDRQLSEVKEVIHNFVPVAAARGAVNLSGLFDLFLASFLVQGAVSMMGYAQTLYVLPVSLFGMSIAAAELPELARDQASGLAAVKTRSEEAIRKVLFWMVPSAVGYVLFREELVAAIYGTGAFQADDAKATGLVLAAYAIGLPASGVSRVLASSFYALRDTRTPARIAYVRILVSAGLGAALMFPLDRFFVGALGLGAVGLALGAAAGAWVELTLLLGRLGGRLGGFVIGVGYLARLLLAVALAAAVGLLIQSVVLDWGPIRTALVTVAPFGVLYLLLTRLLGAAPKMGAGAGPGTST
ncbi:MAG: murein biosynthesis integral membrane protein MurJ [Longimicrobiales bacterium]